VSPFNYLALGNRVKNYPNAVGSTDRFISMFWLDG
jgi:hypothetical protein